ncbi:hypothetical protein [Roseivivax halodurans]|uniref:hypothetical protein n=1 Tax=Roseivivax halodurans TaxID=93683 RepID=UPI0004B3E735|nr:hypothetical protein [Roseivivax halodurans]
MILTWAKYQSGPASGVIGYFLDTRVRKQINGRSVLTDRDPAPEILLGFPSLIGSYIDALPFRSRYRSCVLSFSADELDVRAFNAGVGSEPRAVSGALRLLVEMAYAGVPGAARPPVLASTHTHLGRLEVNVLLPRAVGLPGERLRSINPHPPGRASRDEWDAYTDVVNATYGWADPRCPMRRRHVTPPGWMAKEAAELMRQAERGERVGVDQSDPRYRAWSLCRQATAAGLATRDEIVAHVDAGLVAYCWAVTSQSRADITCGPIDGRGRRVTIGGAALGDGVEDATDPFDAMVARQEEIAAAPAKLAEAHRRRAEFNRRLGSEPWPVVIRSDPAELLDGPTPLMASGGARRFLLGRLINRLVITLSNLVSARAFTALSTASLKNCAFTLETTCNDLTRRKSRQQPHGTPDRTPRDAPRAPDGRIAGGPARRHHRAALPPRARDEQRVPLDGRGGTEVGRGGDTGRLGGRGTTHDGSARPARGVPGRDGFEDRPYDRDARPAAGSRAEWLAVTRQLVFEIFGGSRFTTFGVNRNGQECIRVAHDHEVIILSLRGDEPGPEWCENVRKQLSEAANARRICDADREDDSHTPDFDL